MRRTGILLIAVAISVALLLIPSVPLGVPGEWDWPRRAMPDGLAELLDRLLIPFLTAVGLLSFCRGVDLHIHRLTRLIQFLLLVVLAACSLGWLTAVRQAAPSPHRELRPLWVLYDKFSSGYFYEAAFRTESQTELLSTYEARMAKGDVFHEGTHPPGLFLLNWWAIQATAGSETLTAIAERTQLSSTVVMFRKLEAEANVARPLSRTELAALCLVSFLSTLLAGMTVIPVFGLVSLVAGPRTAWRAASLMLTVPTISVFAPRSDVVYAFSATLLLWMIVAGWIAPSSRGRALWSLLAGVVAFVSLTISLAHLTVLVAGAAFAILSLTGRDRLPLRRIAIAAMLMISPFVVLCVGWERATDCNLFTVWKLNLANHAAFYSQFTRTWWKWALVNPLELSMAVGLPVTVFSVYGFVRSLRHCLAQSYPSASEPASGVHNASVLVGQRHFFRNSNPKRKRGKELGTIPRSRFGLQKRSVSAKTGAVQLGKPSQVFAGSQNAARLIFALTGTWILLWLSGKNMGEAARLWCFLTPWFVISGTVGVLSCCQSSCESRVESVGVSASRTAPAASVTTKSFDADGHRDWLLLLIAQLIVCTITVGRVSGYLEL